MPVVVRLTTKQCALSVLTDCYVLHAASLKFTAADAVTATVTAVLVLLDGTVSATIVVAFALEITGMTACTEWRVD